MKLSTWFQGIWLLQDLYGTFEAFGALIVIDKTYKVFTLTEKPLTERLDILLHRSLYIVALSVAQSEQVVIYTTTILITLRMIIIL